MTRYQDEKGFINTQIDKHGIAKVTFYHPSQNSFPRLQLEELASNINTLSKNKEVKIISLQSEGNRTFCAGANFDELLTIKTREEGKNFFSGFALVINAIRLSRKLVTCKVQGKAIGGGLGLAAACDYCFATEQASIRLSELGLNMGPFVIAPAVERKIGLSAFTKLTLNPDEYKDAQWAKTHGLFQEVFPDLDSMEKAMQRFCRRLSSYNTETLAEIKSVFWQDTDHWDVLLFERANISGKVVLSEETKASLNSFKKRNK